MTKTNVHLEEVTMAARRGVALAVGVALLAMAAMLLAGLPLLVALVGAAMLLALGSASGGFGLVARLAFRGPRPQRPAVSGGSVAPLRVPQVR
jgi:uncharacterized membrane protein